MADQGTGRRPSIQWAETIAGKVPLIDARVVLKNEVGRFEGYFSLRVPGIGIVAALDTSYYTDEVFVEPGDDVQVVLRHHGGFSGRKVAGGQRVRTLAHDPKVEEAWRGHRIVGEILADSYVGSVVDCGAPVAAFFALAENEALLQQRKKAGKPMRDDEVVRPAPGDWIEAHGDLACLFLRRLELVCVKCAHPMTFATTSFPSQDEKEHRSRCVCGREILCEAHPEQCPSCRRKMWTWVGEGFAFPMECPRCGAGVFDFLYGHQPLHHTREGQRVQVPDPPSVEEADPTVTEPPEDFMPDDQ